MTKLTFFQFYETNKLYHISDSLYHYFYLNNKVMFIAQWSHRLDDTIEDSVSDKLENLYSYIPSKYSYELESIYNFHITSWSIFTCENKIDNS